MKKCASILMAMLLTLPLYACSDKKGMSIEPSQFSEETAEVLEIFDDIQFFDISFDESAKSQKISVWVYRDGQWQEDGVIEGEIQSPDERIAVQLTDTGFDLYLMDESGHTQYSYPSLETALEDSAAVLNWKIEEPVPVELDQEVAFWVKTGVEEHSMRTEVTPQDFRSTDCNAGIAVTLTVSEQEIG